MTEPESKRRPEVLRIGTRGSALALRQAERVSARLEAAHPGLRCELVVISTQGDRDKQTPLAVIGGQGIFVKELQRALIDRQIDCAVHSLKDLPTVLLGGLVLAAVLERDDPRDVLITPDGATLATLRNRPRVGTSSRRRVAQILEARPDAEVVELRGNLDTRMRKVLEGSDERYDAAVLAAAGVRRMGWSERISEYLDLDVFTPPPGQAALGIECREDDQATRDLVAAVDDEQTRITTGAERAFLRAIGAGCRSPVGAHASLDGEDVRLRAMVASEDLATLRRATITERADAIEDAAGELALELLAGVQ